MREAFTLMFGLLASAATYFFGGWSQLLDVLVYMVIIDYCTGFLAAWMEQRLSSSIGFKGIGKKLLIFVAVTVAHKLDIALNSAGFLMNTAIYFYIANEGLSLFENITRAGLPVPRFIRNALIQLKKQTDGGEKSPEDKEAS
ncbi:phage holin family protein [Aneurinibacillus sp. Ricciae_BoGa-3]|uniref:phage holin family protein n=1 Tax=Aneurinibacillus sp. Ricciae_BoGa-3 TaxID=3022697 RepID=UPI002341FC71|nr:phage holin family protein [Aneurinibacillus sp. Ricciae_BoGa-3]WCK53824.1 phage holin family protein [Aneurinibacillus sp. Ricciae_BoGa-3]